MQSNLPMLLAKRCRAHSKRSGKPCHAPAVGGWNVCRLHGAGGGAPKGNKNALKHGYFSTEGIASRSELHALLNATRATIANL